MLLKNIANIKGGKRLPKGMMLTSLPNKHPYIRVRDLTNSVIELSDTFEFVPEEVLKHIKNYYVNTGDVLLSIVGTIGLTSIVGKSLNNANLTENCVKLVNFKNYLSKYVFYYLNSSIGQYQINRGIVGSTQPKLPIYNIEILDIPEISLPEQQHIVNILGSIDDKIENNEKKVVKLETFKHQLFVQYEDSSAECEVVKLSSIIKFIKGKKPSDDKINLDNYLNIEGITSTNYQQQCSNNMIMANEDDILMVMDGASSGTVYTGHKGIVSSTLSKLEILEKRYKFLVLEKLIQMNNKIKELNTGSAIPHTNKDFILSLSIEVKNDKQLDIFNSKTSDVQNKIIDIKKQNVKLNKLKQLYLKKFFN